MCGIRMGRVGGIRICSRVGGIRVGSRVDGGD